MFEKSEHICSVTPSCSIWHSKVKSAWPASPREYVAFTAQYTSSQRVDICSTSCIGDNYEHYALPKETSDFVRATLDLSGWRLDALNNNQNNTTLEKKPTSSSFAVSVRYVLQTHFQGWIPWYLLNQLTTQAPNVPTSAYQYLKKHGAPPCVEDLVMATMQQQRYDHNKKNWRFEYTRSITIGDLGPTKVTVRLDRRRWAFYSSSGNGSSHYNITIDPPPSNVVAEARKEDPYGIWLVIEHDESFIIPRRGKILVLIKPGKPPHNQHLNQLHKKKRHSPVTLLINGTTTHIQNDHAAATDTLDYHPESNSGSVSPLSPSSEPPSSLATPSPLLSPTTTTPSNGDNDDHNGVERDIQRLTVSPMEQAQGAFLYMKRMDEPFGWTVVSDKQGLRINKRSGTKSSSSSTSSTTPKGKTKSASITASSSNTPQSISNEALTDNEGTKAALENYYMDVLDPCVIFKASKVIENFSIEEVASVVTNISQARVAYDSSLEKCEMVKPIQRGCQVIRQEIKGIFPFKSRELYLTSCTAVEKTLGPSGCKRILYVESSLDLPTSKSSKLPRGKMFISGWILESIDPYTTTTNHPIPSMRATYIVALDLGSSVPSYLSNMCASGIVSKKIQGVEHFLKQNGPLPYLVHPLPMVGLRKNKCVDIQLLSDDKDTNEFAINSSSNNTNNSDAAIGDASKTVYPLSTTRMTTLRWVDIQAIYGQQPLFIVKSQCQYQQPPPPITPRSSTLLSALETTSSSPDQSSTLSPLSIQPTSSQSASRTDRRHSSISSIHSTQSHRRGSMPPGSPSASAATATVESAMTTSFVSKQRNLDQRNNTRSPLSDSMMVDPILCEVIVDLQTFTQGYDVMIQFRQHQDNSEYNNSDHHYDEGDLSGLLSVTISELTPTPSHLLMEAMDSSTAPPGKHAIQVKLVASQLSQTTLFQPKDMDMFDLNLTLQRHQPVVTTKPTISSTTTATKSANQKDGDRLTMSDILGDDEDDTKKTGTDSTSSRWQGVVFVDGQMVSNYGEEIKITSKRKPTVPATPVLSSPRKEVSFSPLLMDTGDSIHDLIKRDKRSDGLDDDDDDDDDQASIYSSSSSSVDTMVRSMTAGSSKGVYLGGNVVNAALGGVNVSILS
ncbi:hypothetical protein BC941DRAFT_62718 [Chlamydoabsidia padenii]|nr:hypothetical protein BC941DRAFT_62718 [Chlamydoabsidia padenii]